MRTTSPGGPYTVTATVGTLGPATFSLTNIQNANAIPVPGMAGLIGLMLLLAAAGVLVLEAVFRS